MEISAGNFLLMTQPHLPAMTENKKQLLIFKILITLVIQAIK